MGSNNLPAKKYSKTNPTSLRLSFVQTGNATRFVDIGLALSIINRKAYRQGVYYYVNSVELYNNEDAYVDLHTLPDNYVTKNSWNRGFGKYMEMASQVDTPRPKYHDFKIRMSPLQTESNTMYPEMFGINGAYTSYSPDEWDFSKLTTMKSDGGAADSFTLTMIGDHVGPEGNRDSVGLIKSYQDTRRQPDNSGQPVIPAAQNTDPLATLFDASGDAAQSEIMDNLDEDNDQTPYNADAYIGVQNNSMQHVARLATTNMVGRVTKASGFCAPMGLICVDPQDTATSYRLVINLAAGTYNGVYAERA